MMHRTLRTLLRTASAAAVVTVALASAHAQTLFQPLTAPGSKSFTLTAGTKPYGVAVADFNHDGYPDMVVANYTSNTISVYLSTGTGTFAAPTSYPTCSEPTAILAEDLDLTGLPDIAVTCQGPTSNVIQVWLNLGNGTFNPSVDGITNVVLGTGIAPVSIVSGDFNNDGHPDLAVANQGDGTVTLFLSNAANNFTYYIVKTLSGLGLGTPVAITAGRFTSRTGNMDLAVVDQAGRAIHILTGDGTGNFTVGSSPATGVTPTAIAAGDFNNDGVTDLAVLNSGRGVVGVLLGNGNGTFKAQKRYRVGPNTGNGGSALIAVDIQGHGILDLIAGNTLTNTVGVLIGNGNGTFQAVQDYAMPNGPAYLAAADFNRDGKPDLAVTQSTGGTLSVLINNTLPTPEPGGRNFFTPHTLTNGHGNMADGIVAADFNHDGYPDLAATYLEDNSVRVLTGVGGGNFRTPADVYPVGKQPYWVASGDLNNDGYADLVTANTGDNTVSVLMNHADGSGTFAAAVSYPVGHLPYQVAIGDLNGDGIPDIAATNYGDNTVSILYGQPGGSFTSGQTLATCTNPYGVVIGDFRHSGQNDVAVTCFHTAQLDVFLNNGMLPYSQTPPPAQTTFQSPEILSTDIFPTSLVVGDFNRDGNLDIVTGNSIANSVSFFAGNGDGTFKGTVNSFALNFPDSIAAGDLNGDGILDLATVAPNYNQVAVLLGNGDGTFQQRAEFASGQQPWAVALADFNLDGKLDIATANTFNRVNLTIPAYQQMYMKEFPAVPNGHPSLNVSLNSSGTNITLSISPGGTVQVGTAVTVTATVTPTLGSTTPTGSVIFEDTDGGQSAAVPLNGGSASVTTSLLSAGTHRFTVLYSGDTLYQPRTVSNPNFTLTVTGTPVTLSFQPNPITPTTPVSYSVTIGTAAPGQPNPVGTVTLYAFVNGGQVTVDGPNPVGVAGTGGVTTFTKSLGAGIPVGNYYGYAIFQPGAGSPYAPGSSPQVLLVSQ